jgi:hypothetical protein
MQICMFLTHWFSTSINRNFQHADSFLVQQQAYKPIEHALNYKNPQKKEEDSTELWMVLWILALLGDLLCWRIFKLTINLSLLIYKVEFFNCVVQCKIMPVKQLYQWLLEKIYECQW